MTRPLSNVGIENIFKTNFWPYFNKSEQKLVQFDQNLMMGLVDIYLHAYAIIDTLRNN